MKILWTIFEFGCRRRWGLVRVVGSRLVDGRVRICRPYLGTFRVVFWAIAWGAVDCHFASLVGRRCFGGGSLVLIWGFGRTGGGRAERMDSWVTLPIVFRVGWVAAVFWYWGRVCGCSLALAAWDVESEPRSDRFAQPGLRVHAASFAAIWCCWLFVAAVEFRRSWVLAFCGVRRLGLALADSFGGSHVPAEYSVAIFCRR